jgi:2-amino-4-hydroxy-6-hydroxymethyldihydropteridine diphosphokinase
MDVYLLLGSNLGNKFAAIQDARHEIEKVFGKLKKYSSVYEAEPWGFLSEELFLNQVVLIDTNESPDKILDKILAIERKIGRDKEQHGSKSRIIDIDILLYGDEIINDPELTIPHPRMHLRNFALIPLMEIAPSRVHPLLHKTIEQIKSECPDKLRVKKLENLS